VTAARTPIDAIAEAWVDTELELIPEARVMLGRPGREGEYGDHSPAGAAAYADAARAALARLRAVRPVDTTDEVTARDLGRELELVLDRFDAGCHLGDLDVIASPAQGIREVFDLMPTGTEQDWAWVAARMRHVPGAIDGYLESLRAGIAAGRVPARRQVAAVIAQLDEQASGEGFFGGLAAEGAAAHAALAGELSRGAGEAGEAYDRLRAFLAEDLAPRARADDAVGRDAYRLASRGFLGAEIDLDETYEWGVEELARVAAEQEAVARRILPGAGVAEAIAHLESDPARKLHGTAALRAWMQEVSDRAIAELGASAFDIPEPLRRLECMIAPTRTGGIYYTPPSEDFARPGQMWWSVPEGVEDFDTWRELTTVYHEGAPGHHLQHGQAVLRADSLNTWRRQNFVSGHGEGWALYAERLMAELGYLDDPADLLGMLDGQRLRALRVVLDLGVHLGKPRLDGTGVWDYDYALAQMREHVHMPEPFLVFETQRYLGWPGQAPSYKIGQRVWEELRAEAERAAGDAWDVKAWHRRALELGGVGLDTLRWAMRRAGADERREAHDAPLAR